MKIKNLFKGEGFVNFSSSILAIVCGLLFGLIILLISNPSQAFGGFMMIIQGGVYGWNAGIRTGAVYGDTADHDRTFRRICI